jgi:ABC-type lipoprotein release transport system permease subunit
MTFGPLLLRNLLYHWRGNSAVFLGVAVGTAVLAGALFVGDSLRGSLRDLAEQRLGWVDHGLVTGRFVRQELANELAAGRVCPALFLQGAVSTLPSGSEQGRAAQPVRRAGKVAILGVDERFWSAGHTPGGDELWQSADGAAVINRPLAAELGVGPGSELVLHLQKVSAIPRETLLGRRDTGETLDAIPVTIREVVPDEGLGSFSLNPSPAAPRNVFVPLAYLQSRLDLKGRVNALLVNSGGRATTDLQADLKRHLTLADWGLLVQDPRSRTKTLFDKLDRNHNGKLPASAWQGRVAGSFVKAVQKKTDDVITPEEATRHYNRRGFITLESKQMLLEPAAVAAALTAAQDAGLRAAPTLVYLANSITELPPAPSVVAATAAGLVGAPLGAATTLIGAIPGEVPYSLVAALDPSQPPPLGPFLPPGSQPLGDKEIVLTQWKESPLRAGPGDEVSVTYFSPEEQGRLGERSETFRVRAIIPLQGVADDPDLTPEFPGITDKLDLRAWDPPFPYDNQRVKPRDERYWREYRTTPKGYVNLETGQRLWGSRFGQLTSIRLAPAQGEDLVAAAERLRTALLSRLDPEQGGLVFDNVRQRGLDASAAGSNFGWLFLGFSIFLIVAALLLVGLLFRLNLDRRASEIGILLAAGYRRTKVRCLLLLEGGLLAVGGGLVGLSGAVLYAWLLLKLLVAWWPGAMDRTFLRLHFTGLSFFLGYFAALVVSVLTIAWAVRVLSRVSPRALLDGETTAAEPGGQRRPPRWSLRVCIAAAVIALLLLVAGGFVRDQDMRAGSFFGGGALLLTAALAGVWAWMGGSRHVRVSGHGGPALARLGVRNAARHPVRSLLTAGLLASSAFLIVAVESFRRQPEKDFLDRDSGGGGFALLGESDLPVYQDLNSANGPEDLNEAIDRQLRRQRSAKGERVTEKIKEAQATLGAAAFVPFRLRTGDDASCLNLYQPRRPRLLGVPESLIRRGGFRFARTDARSEEERRNPWRLLEGGGEAIPVFAEKNTAEWMLHLGLGDSLQVPDETGRPRDLRIVGLLKDSVFQRELLMSEANFLKLYPGHGGYNVFLIDAPPDKTTAVKGLLETALADHGLEVASTKQALEAYLAVENTYLSTFQLLGGLGLVLGAMGLAVVLLRGVWERRGELALLRALGYRQGALGWLVLAENGFLLLLGLVLGTAAALLAVAPHLVAEGGEVPWLRLFGLLGLVVVVGLAAGAAAVRTTLRAPLLASLRRE